MSTQPSESPTLTAAEQDARFMQMAIEEARQAAAAGEVPVGAVVVLNGEVIGAGGNRSIRDHDPTAHAEIVALRKATARIRNYRIPAATLYVTVEPCAMCAGALVLARIARLVYGCDDPKAGAVRSLYQIADDARLNHRVDVTSRVMANECAALLQDFFQSKRTV
jgi:tRNA(adenine34) deaminase